MIQQQQQSSNHLINTDSYQIIHDSNSQLHNNQHQHSHIHTHSHTQQYPVKLQSSQSSISTPLFPIQMSMSMKEQQNYQQKQPSIFTFHIQYNQLQKLQDKIYRYQNKYSQVFTHDMNRPGDFILQLLQKLQDNRILKQKVMNKYGEMQIQMRQVIGQIHADSFNNVNSSSSNGNYRNISNNGYNRQQKQDQRQKQYEKQRQKIRNNFKKCLEYHNVWSSRNGITMMITDNMKRVQIFGNNAFFTKKNRQKLTANLAIFNKIPQNSIFQIRLKLTHLNAPLLVKQDYIRLKLYPGQFISSSSYPNSSSSTSSSAPCTTIIPTEPSTYFQFTKQSSRCLTIDLQSLQSENKQNLINGDILKFRLDLFNKNANAYCNQKFIKYNEDVKLKIKKYGYQQKQCMTSFVPVFQVCISGYNNIGRFNMDVGLEYLYKEI